MKNHSPVLVSAAALFGSLMGLLSLGGATAAPIEYAVYINPGGASNAMTCGWHVACAPPFTWGNALDWGNSGGSSITWRSWGFRASGSGPLGAATVGSNSSSGCYRFSARVTSLNGTLRGEAIYTHATTGIVGTQWNVNAGIPIGGAFTSRTGLGNTTASERSGCLWNGQHLHQSSTSTGWFANTGVYPSAPSTGTGYNLSALNNWQNRSGTWSE